MIGLVIRGYSIQGGKHSSGICCCYFTLKFGWSIYLFIYIGEYLLSLAGMYSPATASTSTCTTKVNNILVMFSHRNGEQASLVDLK